MSCPGFTAASVSFAVLRCIFNDKVNIAGVSQVILLCTLCMAYVTLKKQKTKPNKKNDFGVKETEHLNRNDMSYCI